MDDKTAKFGSKSNTNHLPEVFAGKWGKWGGKGTVKLSVGELEGGGSAMCVFCDFW